MIETTRHIPFGEHIAHFPGEPKPDNFMLATAMFANDAGRPLDFSDEKVIAATLLIDRLVDPNTRSKQLYDAKKDLERQCNEPGMYPVLAQLIENQSGILEMSPEPTDRAKLQRFRQVADRVKEIAQPVDNVNIHCYFSPHDTLSENEYLKKRDLLLDVARKTFKKEDVNIMFMEDATSDLELQLLTWQGLRKFGSLRLALAYSSVMYRGGKGALEEVVQEDLTVQRRLFRMPDQHFYMKAEIFDTLVKEGYQIEAAFEDNSGSTYHPSSDAQNVRTIEDEKRFFTNLAKDGRRRDGAIAQQIRDIAIQKNNEGVPTNILVLMGNSHTRILKDLPAGILAKTTSTVDVKPPSDAIEEVSYRVSNDLPVDETLWQAAFELHTGKS